MTRSVLTPIAVFLCSVAIYVALWNYVSHGGLHGADAINVVGARASLSYALKHKDIVKPDQLFQRLASPRDPAAAFVTGLLTEQGRTALVRLARGDADDQHLQRLLFELNSRIIDRDVAWPAGLLPAGKKIAGSDLAARQQFNRQVMAGLFGGMINDGTRMPFRELIAGKINFKSFFVQTAPNRYAPLTTIYITLMTLFVLDDPGNLAWAALIVACLYGLQMLFIYLLAFEALQSVRWALAATALFLASIPALLTTYSLFALPYLFIPLATAAAAYFYLRYRKQQQGGYHYLFFFFLAAFAGPWFREAALVMPFIVCLVEFVTWQGRRSLPVVCCCLLLMVHGIYPSFYPWLVGVNTGSYFSILQGAAMKAQMGGGLNPTAPGTVFVQIPPLLWLGALIAMTLAARSFTFGWSSGEAGLHRRLLATIGNSRWGNGLERLLQRLLPLLPLVIGMGGMLLLFSTFRSTAAPTRSVFLALFSLLLLFAVYSLKHSVFFPVYFMAMLLPFVRINGNTEIHASFILPPMIIMLLFWLRELWRMRAVMKRPAAAAVGALLLVGGLDQITNVQACATSQRAAVGANRQMGSWFAANTPRHSIVVANFFNIADVFYYSGYHIDPYESVENCPLGPAKVVHKNGDMQRLLAGNRELRPVYLVNGDVDRFPFQKGYHSHKYVANPPGSLQELTRFSVQNRYWYLDPLKYFIPRWFVSIPVYMDWSIDYYYNNEKTPFRRLLKADYIVYRLDGIDTTLLDEKPALPAAAQPAPVPAPVAETVKPSAPAAAAVQPPVVTASSVMDKTNPGMSPAGILMGQGIWHAQSPPRYPEWIEIAYPAPFEARRFSMLPQPSSPGGNEYIRAPRDFTLSGSNDRKTWTELLVVRNNSHRSGMEWHHWKLKNRNAWRYYRLTVTASGEPNLLTIGQLKLEEK